MLKTITTMGEGDSDIRGARKILIYQNLYASLPTAEPPSVTAPNAAVPSATLKLSEALIVRRRVFVGAAPEANGIFAND